MINGMIKRKHWAKIAAGIVLLYAGFLWAFFELPDEKMHVWFLDVGQGDSILIQTPDGANVLVDGGPGGSGGAGGSSGGILEKLASHLPFFNKKIDLIVLTHPHSDHLNGLVEVLKKYEVNAVMMTGIEYNNSYYEEFLREVCLVNDETSATGRREDCPRVFIANASQDFRFGEVYFDVIYPFYSLVGAEFEDVNDSSIAMRVSYGERSVLLTGDDSALVESEILRAGFDVSAEIFKASHHGSKTANSLPFLQAVSPSTVVIQVGADNKFGHPHAEALEVFGEVGVREVRRNDWEGDVEIE